MFGRFKAEYKALRDCLDRSEAQESFLELEGGFYLLRALFFGLLEAHEVPPEDIARIRRSYSLPDVKIKKEVTETLIHMESLLNDIKQERDFKCPKQNAASVVKSEPRVVGENGGKLCPKDVSVAGSTKVATNLKRRASTDCAGPSGPKRPCVAPMVEVKTETIVAVSVPQVIEQVVPCVSDLWTFFLAGPKNGLEGRKLQKEYPETWVWTPTSTHIFFMCHLLLARRDDLWREEVDGDFDPSLVPTEVGDLYKRMDYFMLHESKAGREGILMRTRLGRELKQLKIFLRASGDKAGASDLSAFQMFLGGRARDGKGPGFVSRIVKFAACIVEGSRLERCYFKSEDLYETLPLFEKMCHARPQMAKYWNEVVDISQGEKPLFESLHTRWCR
jgi:hypothetical protein